MFHYTILPTPEYPNAPFDPDEAYPELTGLPGAVAAHNQVYRGVRDLLMRSGLDSGRVGTPAWNPFGEFLKGRSNVVVKPNLVLHHVGELPGSIEALVVHASVIRPLIDYLLVASRAENRAITITIADTPLQSADFETLCEQNGLKALMDHYARQGVTVNLCDLRFEHARINDNFLILERIPLPGDPAGARIVNVGVHSVHTSRDGKADFSIQDYDDEATRENHSGMTHKYKFSQSVLDADLVINIPKMKCHGKSGVTLAMKNIVGANVSKDYLPHFRAGSPSTGGDECPTMSIYTRCIRSIRNWFNRHQGPRLAVLHRLLKRAAYWAESRRRSAGQETGFGGAWHGNDTLWRTIVDINRILFFSNREGHLQFEPQRKVLFLLDGVIGMEGEGPLKGTDIPSGVLAFGDDPVEFDASVTALMGLNPERVPHIAFWKSVGERQIGTYPQRLPKPALERPFREPNGWKGKLSR